MWKLLNNIIITIITLLVIPVTGMSQNENETEMPENWTQFKNNGGGTLKIYYYEEPLFAYTDSTGELTGIAIDVTKKFVQYVEKTENVDIDAKFIKQTPFPKFYNTVKNSDEAVLGVGSVTITEERKKNIDFSPPFFVNKAVLLTNPQVPAVSSRQGLSKLLSGKKMLVYKGTTQEQYYSHIRNEMQSDIQVDYVQSDEAILDAVSSNENVFGCVDLPVLINAIKQGIDIRYQPKADIRGEDFGFITPKNSGWKPLMKDFFEIGYGFKSSRIYSEIVSKHLGDNLDSFLKLAENPDL